MVYITQQIIVMPGLKAIPTLPTTIANQSIPWGEPCKEYTVTLLPVPSGKSTKTLDVAVVDATYPYTFCLTTVPSAEGVVSHIQGVGTYVPWNVEFYKVTYFTENFYVAVQLHRVKGNDSIDAIFRSGSPLVRFGMQAVTDTHYDQLIFSCVSQLDPSGAAVADKQNILALVTALLTLVALSARAAGFLYDFKRKARRGNNNNSKTLSVASVG